MEKVLIVNLNRIGRMCFAQLYQAKGYEVAICDIVEPQFIAGLLHYDSQPKNTLFKEVSFTEAGVVIDGKEFTVHPTLDTDRIVEIIKNEKFDVVIDCTSFFISENTMQKYLDAGAKKVITPDILGSAHTMVRKIVPDTLENAHQ